MSKKINVQITNRVGLKFPRIEAEKVLFRSSDTYYTWGITDFSAYCQDYNSLLRKLKDESVWESFFSRTDLQFSMVSHVSNPAIKDVVYQNRIGISDNFRPYPKFVLAGTADVLEHVTIINDRQQYIVEKAIEDKSDHFVYISCDLFLAEVFRKLFDLISFSEILDGFTPYIYGFISSFWNVILTASNEKCLGKSDDDIYESALVLLEQSADSEPVLTSVMNLVNDAIALNLLIEDYAHVSKNREHCNN